MHQFQGATTIAGQDSSPLNMGCGSLSLPFKKREAARIDSENYKFGMRIISKKPEVETAEMMRQSHNRKMKTLQML